VAEAVEVDRVGDRRRAVGDRGHAIICACMSVAKPGYTAVVTFEARGGPPTAA
jgi:hypothetical protein